MVKNNIQYDIRVKMLEAGKTQQEVAEQIGTSQTYLSALGKKVDGVVNRTLVKVMDALGYDIVLTYVKKDGI